MQTMKMMVATTLMLMRCNCSSMLWKDLSCYQSLCVLMIDVVVHLLMCVVDDAVVAAAAAADDAWQLASARHVHHLKTCCRVEMMLAYRQQEHAVVQD